VGGGAGEFVPGHRRDRRYLGAARWPAIRRLARCDPLPSRGVTHRWKGGLGVVAGHRRLRGSGAVLQIFGGSDDPRRDRFSADRAGKPPLAVATASLCRRSRRAGDIRAGPVLECAARLGVVSVPGRSGGGSLPPAGAGFDARRRRLVSVAVDLVAVGRVRVRRAAPGTGRQKTLAPGMPGGAADCFLHADLAAEPGAVSLGGARLSDAAAAARRCYRPARAEPPVARGDRSCCYPRRGVRRQRGTVRLAAADDRRFSARQGPRSGRSRLDFAAHGACRKGTARPAGAGRRGDAVARCRKDRLCLRRPGAGCLPRQRSTGIRDHRTGCRLCRHGCADRCPRHLAKRNRRPLWQAFRFDRRFDAGHSAA
jgi:hypothetical protein